MDPRSIMAAAYWAADHLPHGRAPTHKHLRVLRSILCWRGAPPSQAQLAASAGCCVGTVANALARWQELAVLLVQPTRRRLPGGLVVRGRNLYRALASCLQTAWRESQTHKPRKDSSRICGAAMFVDRSGAAPVPDWQVQAARAELDAIRSEMEAKRRREHRVRVPGLPLLGV